MFYRSLAILTVILVALVLLLPRVVPYQIFHHNTLLFIGFFVLLTGFTYRFVKTGYDKNPDNFTNYFLASVVMRLMVSLAVFLAYLFLYSDTTLRYAFTFIGLYFLYTGFEIYHIVRNLRPFSKNP